MSERIKYGETYESLAKNIEPYLDSLKPRLTATYSRNIYPVWWDTTITIYNRYEDATTNYVKWYRTVLDGCFFKSTHNSTTAELATFETYNILTRIPQNDRFMEYGEWLKVPDNEKGAYFSIHSGDIVIKGEIETEIDEYSSGAKSNDLLSVYREIGQCFVVKNYQNNTGNGRVAPHYYLGGE